MFENFDTFWNKIQIAFNITNNIDYAIKIVKIFWQTISTFNYIFKFQEYIDQTGWNNISFIEIYKNNLKKFVKNEIMHKWNQIQNLIILQYKTIKINNWF